MAGIDSYVQIMAHCNGTDGSSSFPDDSGHSRTITRVGTAQVDTAQSKFGGASGLMDGNSDYLTVTDFAELDLGSADFTFDFWVKFNSLATNQCFFARYDTSTYFYFAKEAGNIRFREYTSDIINKNWAYTFDTTNWFHIELVRYGDNIKLFINGTQQGTDTALVGTKTFTARSSNLLIGYLGTGSYFLDGWIEEFRFSPGIARDISNFTPPTEEYSAGNVTVSPSTLTATAVVQSPTVVIPITVSPSTLTASAVLQVPFFVGPFQEILPSTLSAIAALQSPSILISSTVFPSLLTATASLQSPFLPGLSTVRNATKIISFNPLIIVTNNNPLTLGVIDTTDPENPITTLYYIIGASGAKDVVYDSVFEKIFIACENGIIAEVDATDFSSYTLHDTGVITNLEHIDSLPGFQTIFASTDYSLGEIVVLDDSVKTIISTDIRFRQLISEILNCHINTVEGKILNTDIRWSETVNNILGMDIRFNAVAVGEYEEPISRLDFHVFLDNIELTDVKKDAINVYHVDNEKSRATIILARQHDRLDYTLAGVYSQITNQNALRVEIDEHVEFNGFINQIDVKSEDESVQLIAFTDDPKLDERSLVTLSIPSIDEKLNLHHALVHNPVIENPRVLPDDLNPSFYNGILIDAGYNEAQNISRWELFAEIGFTAAKVTLSEEDLEEYAVNHGYSAGSVKKFVPEQNWTYFWFAKASNFITGTEWLDMRYVGTSPASLTSDTWEITGMAYWFQRKFDSSKIRLGNGIVYANDFKYVYTWDAKRMYNILKPHGSISYNGASIEYYKNQPSVYSIMQNNIGYQFGSAPFKKVSCKAGILRAKDAWVDHPDGLYSHRDESYDYRQFAQIVGALELQKIQNINGDILPKTSADIEVFIDGYYYYNLTLLKRINIDNTVSSNIYKNNNGFPISIKSVEIDSSTMKVTMHCDNQWSRTEMLEIEAEYPAEDSPQFLFSETNTLLSTKFDTHTLKEVQ